MINQIIEKEQTIPGGMNRLMYSIILLVTPFRNQTLTPADAKLTRRKKAK